MSSILTKQKAGPSGFPGGFKPASTFQGASSTSEIQANDDNGAAIRLQLPAGMLSDRSGVIRVMGRMLGAAGNLTLKVYDGLLNGTLLATSGAIAAADGSFMFVLHVNSDPTSDKLWGYLDGHIGGTIITHAVISNAAFDPDIAHSLSVSLTFSSSNSANGVQVRTFEIDLD